MKPINLNTAPCVPMSSNCVIWQGDNIPCINLCHGDTVSDVVFKLATELCTIMDQLNVSNYDLTCFGITACGPNDFQALIQFLITQICELQGVTPTTKENTTGCPDCLVTVAPCFVVGGQTTMNLTDYVNMIAERICDIVDELVIINAALVDLNIRVTTLENAIPPSFTIPSYITDCQIGSLAPANWDIDVILEAFTNDVWCSFYDATGTTSEILAAVAAQCIFGTSLSKTYPGVQMQIAYPSWDATPDTLASTINNIWISLCDLYSSSFTVADTNTINLTNTAGIITADIQDTGWVNLLGFDTFMNLSQLYQYPQVRRIGNQLHFRGEIIIPLTDTVKGGPLMWDYSAGTDTYYDQTSVTPFQGDGGVSLISYGSLVFNWDTGTSTNLSVIPTSVIPAGYALDGSYQHPAGWKIAYRSIDAGVNSTILTTVFSIVIGSTGQLRLGLVKDAEEGISEGGAGGYDTSHINSIISHVTLNQNVPKYSSATTTLFDNALSGVQTVSIDFSGGVYPFTCNANDQTQIGGFKMILNGLTSYISPCGDLIPTPSPC